MGKKRHSVEQVVRKLREVEVELAKGARVKEVCRKLAITEHTYLLLAERVWWFEAGLGQTPQATREGEHAAEEAAGMSRPLLNLVG